ncbi:MAG: hypothetical protein ACRDSE_13200 [Pseudonocardiaceae bacterium]
MLAFAAICAQIFWTGYQARFRHRKSGARPLIIATTESGSSALKIPYSTRTLIGGAVLLGSIALLFSVAMIQARSSDDPGRQDGAYVWGALAVVFWILLFIAIKYGRGFVLLDAQGILHHGGSFRSYLPWSGVEAIQPVQTDGPDILITALDHTPWVRERLTRLWKADKPPAIPSDNGLGSKPAIHLRGVYFDVDPALVLAILVFYGKHPDARHELGTDAALQRARGGAFG